MKTIIRKIASLFRSESEESVVHAMYIDNENLKKQIKFYQKDLEKSLKIINDLRDQLAQLMNK